MKRILIILATLAICVNAFAQIQITTKKEKLSDFPTKTIKVVLPGDMILNQILKESMKNIWVLSPFEFCTMDEFEAIKNSSDYYFMAVVENKQNKETTAKTYMLDIVKGGTGKNINKMLEVAKFPICATDTTFDRLDAFLPAIINVMQNYIKKSLYTGFRKIKPQPMSKASKKFIFIAEGDLSKKLNSTILQKYTHKSIILTDTDNADQVFIDGANALVSYCIYPAKPEKGSISYNMLFDAKTYELYYYKERKINPKNGGGLLKCDIKKMAISR